jgi:hypothetical protein
VFTDTGQPGQLDYLTQFEVFHSTNPPNLKWFGSLLCLWFKTCKSNPLKENCKFVIFADVVEDFYELNLEVFPFGSSVRILNYEI